MNYASILEQIHGDPQPYLGAGKVADYIPELVRVPVTGERCACGRRGGIAMGILWRVADAEFSSG